MVSAGCLIISFWAGVLAIYARNRPVIWGLSLFWCLFFAGAAFVLYSPPAKAAEKLNCGHILMPPAQYNNPLFYSPTYHIVDLGPMDALCRAIGARQDGNGRLQACSKGKDIYLPPVGPGGVSAERERCLFIHERAHMSPNLWPADHPGAVYW